MQNVKIDVKNTGEFQEKLMEYATKVAEIHEELHKEAEDENEFLGWLELPTNYDKKELEKIKKAAKKIQNDSEILVVIGIGGSYLGARAVIEALTNTFYNYLPKGQRETPQILYVGNNLNPNYINDLIELIGNRDLSINVVSKSGTTTEPAIAFRIFRELLENKYGLKEAKKRIFVTTDAKKGALKQIADEEGYTTFVIPDNIGGRYSVLTAVGLLPIATAGISVEELLNGARFAQEKYLDKNLKYNDCYKYAVMRNLLYESEKNIEILVSYEPKMHYMIEWWKQLFGESEGKEGKGIYPTGAEFTTDLHSLGQYIQEGRRNLFETVINIKESESDMAIHQDEDNLDELNYLAEKSLDYVNKKAMEGTIQAHVEGGVPNIVINMDELNAYNLGHLIYFFELACAMSGKLVGINPFNQPGVEKYKTNMFRLLGKPGYTQKDREEQKEKEASKGKGTSKTKKAKKTKTKAKETKKEDEMEERVKREIEKEEKEDKLEEKVKRKEVKEDKIGIVKKKVEEENEFEEETKVEAVKPKRTRRTKTETKQKDKVEDGTYTIKRKKRS